VYIDSSSDTGNSTNIISILHAFTFLIHTANSTMPRLNKRVRSSQRANHAKKLRRTQEISEPQSPISDLEEDHQSDSEWSEVEDDLSFPITQPIEGWRTAEQGLPLVVRGAAGERSRSTQSYHKRQYELKEEESAKNRVLYGDISRFFQREQPNSEPIQNCIDHLLTFTPRFLPPLFQTEFEEENDMDIYENERLFVDLQ